MDEPLLSFEVDGKALGALHAQGRVAVGEPFAFTVEAYARTERVAVDDLLGKPFKLTLRSARGDTLAVTGVATAVESAVADGATHYLVELGPEIAPLSVGLDSYVFQKMSVVDVIKDVLSSAGVEHVDWQTTGSYEPRDYIAQYAESDWAFIERLCALEGIYYWFELAEDDATKLVFADDSTSAPKIDGDPLPYKDASSLMGEDGVSGVKTASAIAVDVVHARDYWHRTPTVKLDAHSGTGPHEIYDYPGDFRTPSAGDRRTKLRLEALRAHRALVYGDSGALRLQSGKIFQTTDHPVAALDGAYFCIAVSYRARDARSADDERVAEQGLHTTFEAIPKATPLRMPPREVARRTGGPQTGVVCGPSGSEVYMDANGELRVQFYWDRAGKKDDTASTPMRVGQLPMGGSMVRPRVGWDVMVEHHEGNVDTPFIVSHLYDGKYKVPYALPANKTRSAWQTATTPGGGSSNELRFEDKKGSEEMFVNASKDMKVVVGDKKDKKVGANHTHKIGANHDVTIGSDSKSSVKADQTVSIGAVESIAVSGSRSVGVSGGMSSTIGAVRMLTVSKGRSLDANGGRSLTVGGAMMEISALGVSRAVLGSYSNTVGGAWISATALGLSNATLGAATETIGGAKINVGGGGVKLNVKGAASEDVGGAYVITAGGNVGESAGGSLTISVGGAFVANTPNVEIEAESEIAVQVGGSSMKITSGSIEIKAPSLASPGATIGKDGSTIDHNP